MIAWWRDLTLRTKLALCGIAFLVPIGMLLVLLTRQMSANIRLTQVEIKAISVVEPIEDLTETVPEHLRLVLAGFAGEDAGPASAKLESGLRERLGVLEQRMAQHGQELGLNAEVLGPLGLEKIDPKNFGKNLLELLDTRAETPHQAIVNHNAALELLSQLREYVADSGKLVLDPELASYYLMYLLLFDIPRAQERLGWLYTSGYLSLTHLPGAEKERARMEEASASWEQSVVDRITDKLAKARRAIGDEKLAVLPKAVQEYATASRAFLEVSRSLSNPASKVNMQGLMKSAKLARDAGADLWDACNGVFNTLIAERAANLRLRMYSALGVCVGSVILAVMLAWTILTSVSRPLARVANIATLIAQGRVAEASALLERSCSKGCKVLRRNTESGRSQSEINQLFYAVSVMIQGLDELLSTLTATGGQIQTSAQRIAATARQLEASATQQAASTVEVGATSKEISATAASLADTMSEVLGVASKSSALAEEGRESLAVMEQAMDDLYQSGKTMTAKLALVREKTSGIGQLLSTISKVATQTNLLSLNAAIEAEKAGEFGPGFAVVAREIRRLADQTATATLDIERTIRDMQASVQAGSAAMEGFSALAEQTADTSRGVNTKLGRIIASGEELTPRFSTVTQGMRMQAEGADQISEVISQLADNAGQTRDSLAEFRLAAEELNRTAESLREVLQGFGQGR
ncbi:methyl-accepting chemotaxis protein [Fundidesulfovibrio agrisoli]|uniref:methyl-accepting chemotaxis protein n=1 Tax=Fundidesulfovibrio agrisoli TaxID=2922717 RepID=UPI001FAE1073|nr:methyl-accepting chemotaxis protein [Fundidesulfovibrio agrisoli]